jgi:DNA-binding NarL/FixJ family response regulator
VTARRSEIGGSGAGSAIAVELWMDDAELAERVRMMIIERPDIEIVVSEDGRIPEVRITDGAVEPAPTMPVLVLTDASGLMEALQAGASAVLSERADADILCTAIRAAALGLITLSAEFRDHLVDASGSRTALESEAEDEPPIELTPRELQVLRLLAEGASNKSIGRRLGITPHTAKFHVASIVAKLGAMGRTDAVAKAMRLGLVMI